MGVLGGASTPPSESSSMRCVLSLVWRATNLSAEVEVKRLSELCFELWLELDFEPDFELDLEDMQLRFDKERRDPASDAPLELPLYEGGTEISVLPRTSPSLLVQWDTTSSEPESSSDPDGTWLVPAPSWIIMSWSAAPCRLRPALASFHFLAMSTNVCVDGLSSAAALSASTAGSQASPSEDLQLADLADTSRVKPSGTVPEAMVCVDDCGVNSRLSSSATWSMSVYESPNLHRRRREPVVLIF